MKCNLCKSEMKHRDYVKRIHRKPGGIIEWYYIERCICVNCGRIQRDLYDHLIRYKHYDRNVITKALDKNNNDDLYLLYPCDRTVRRWKSQKKMSL